MEEPDEGDLFTFDCFIPGRSEQYIGGGKSEQPDPDPQQRHGVNNDTNRNISTADNSETACAGGNQGSCGGFGGATGPYADMSDPFSLNTDCSPAGFGDVCDSAFDPGLPGGFKVPDNRFGRGPPGPNDITGPPFPYPCHTKGSINQKIRLESMTRTIPASLPDRRVWARSANPIISSDPIRSDPQGPSYRIRFRPRHRRRAEIQDLLHDRFHDRCEWENGGKCRRLLSDENEREFRRRSTCTVTAANPSSEGQFESGMTGVITCIDRAGNACQGSQFNPAKFSYSGGEQCAP